MRSTVRRVVVGVDGSDGSLDALRKAAGEARRHGARLRPVLVHSSPEGDYVDMMWPPDPETARELADRARATLTAACERALGGLPGDLRCEPVVARGQAGPLLVAAACREGDLLVVGGGSHSAVHRLLMGSVSRYCLRHAPCPVLVVPPGPAARRHRHDRHRARPELCLSSSAGRG
ncbi:universal stress protein [Streptomyces eurocidicus]|uniref:Nucleotide-binding universal stress UspA family protein n=1 Tax=Streptomyces eurocidicus TaxID=66423 RepID=A0A7W8BI37_STREU|nr:universal stress protein [Streptomyces eurocidicus]MBB5122353.1 nucleotide-binding universal stress UspA family protein [Streptomyces eurocidicus]MBF6051637.1 universal stress protein [Streptomyces eurocidicus]